MNELLLKIPRGEWKSIPSKIHIDILGKIDLHTASRN